MDQLQRPIGYWLKHLDRLIEASFERIFADEGLTRRDWQVLSTLDAAPMDDGGLPRPSARSGARGPSPSRRSWTGCRARAGSAAAPTATGR